MKNKKYNWDAKRPASSSTASAVYYLGRFWTTKETFGWVIRSDEGSHGTESTLSEAHTRITELISRGNAAPSS